MFQLGKVILQSLVSVLWIVAIASFAVASNIVNLEYLPGNALGLGLITVVGQCMGAGEIEQVKKIYKTNCLGKLRHSRWDLPVAHAPVPPPLGIYNLSPAATDSAVELIVLHSLMMVIWPLAFTLPNALRAASDAKFTMGISIFSMWAFRIGVSYLLVKVFDIRLLQSGLPWGGLGCSEPYFSPGVFSGVKWKHPSGPHGPRILANKSGRPASTPLHECFLLHGRFRGISIE